MSDGLESLESAGQLLTIAIPTFNRCAYLKQLLTVLSDQLKNEARVELIVSDNASTDDTPGVVQGFLDRGLDFRCIRNKENLGAEVNFQQCFQAATGKYVWIIGDDDLIVPGGVAKVLDLLASDEYDLAYLTPYEFRKDYLAERTFDKLGRTAEILPDGLQLVRYAGTMITFVSAIIVNKARYGQIDHPHFSMFAGTNLPHLAWICPVLANSSRNLYVWDRLVAGRGGNCGGWGACEVFGVNLKKISEFAFGDRPDMGAELCNRTLEMWLPQTIMDIRRGITTTLLPENMRALLEPVYRGNWRYWINVFPLLVLPRGIAGCWHAVTTFLNRAKRWPRLIIARYFQRKYSVTAFDFQPVPGGEGRF